VKRNPDWAVQFSQKIAIGCANKLMENEEDDKELINAGICPICFAMGLLVTYKDQTVCFDCGQVIIEVI
jgi:hypothetical protein